MKTVQQIENALPDKLRKLAAFDKREIDNPDLYAHARLNYLDRWYKLLEILKRKYPQAAGICVADIGCGQGNLSLALAELGFKVTAVDIDPDYLEYARLKQERGDVQWVRGNFDELDLNSGFDIIILGELIEHCAYPEDFVQKALRYLKPSGILLITTPNASMFRNTLPTFGKLRAREARKFLEERQFGPDGCDHLFLFKLSEIKYILPSTTRLEETGYLGGTVLINRHTEFLLRWLPVRWAEKVERLVAATPLLNRLTCHGIYAVIRNR
jgi:2-polyprenyl-3-methyl-5-hydroxy-6-metoxy-1,4-benzoquinol methylase